MGFKCAQMCVACVCTCRFRQRSFCSTRWGNFFLLRRQDSQAMDIMRRRRLQTGLCFRFRRIRLFNSNSELTVSLLLDDMPIDTTGTRGSQYVASQ
jgi:hypothetical protein